MSTTVETMIAASVAPASGMRSRIATRSPSAIAKSLPTPKSTAVDVTPATRLIRRFPVTYPLIVR